MYYMKVWIEANKIHMIHELKYKNLRKIDIEIRKNPNFDKYYKGEDKCLRNEKSKKTFKTDKRYKKGF